MDNERPTYTEASANRKLQQALRATRDGGTYQIAYTGINNINQLENYDYTTYEVARRIADLSSRRNAEANAQRRRPHPPVHLDYELKEEACLLSPTFRAAFQRFSRSQ